MTTIAKRVLIVEDQLLVVADLQATLRRIGYEVAGTVTSGEEAVPKASEVCPDLVLMDIRLRGAMDGIEAASQIRAFMDVPIVYLSAYADEASIARAKATTPFGYVLKPFNERELRAAIEIALYKHELEQRLADERAQRRAAEDAVEARDEFISMAGHELNSPLTAVLLLLDSLTGASQREALPERIQRRLQRAALAGRRLEVLVSQLLDVARIRAGRVDIEPVPVDLVAVVRAVVERVAGLSARAGSPIVMRAVGPIVGCWDPSRLDQVVTNLLSNAMKYGKGKPIDVVVFPRADEAVIAVSDHGPGIAKGQQERIFERFARAPGTREYGGIGLGLWIAQSIVQASHGRIEVESEVDNGSTFTVVLPVAAREACPRG